MTADRLKIILFSAFLFAMNGCEGLSWNERRLSSTVRASGEIRVLTLENPLVYSTKGGRFSGLDYDLLTHFANTYDLKIRFIPKKDAVELSEALRAGEGDLAAARLWIPERNQGFTSGPVLEESHLSLFCRRQLKIQHVSDLARRRVVMAAKDNTDQFDVRLRHFVSEVEIEVDPVGTTGRLLKRVSAGSADCALVENLEGALHSRALPAVEKIIAVSGVRPLGWILRPGKDDLRKLMQAWFQRASRDDEIIRMQDHYRANLTHLDRHDVRKFLKGLRRDFPAFAKAFRESAAEHDLDWKLVAAVAYQESHWEPAARSPTGVRGLMQLTLETAEAVGIDDRTDPLQAIWGGAYYLRTLLDRMPRGLEDQDRLSIALAAWNIGLAHIKDAQALAEDRGLNPNSWRHLKKVLPLLEDPEIAATLPFGRARGREAVQFVERVRGFYSLFHLLN